ncbi:hypothetical protein NMY22_g9377 [Coprinellus aureogranulatus]|nr:hypothetical protein NMY22_g9377 [Coprinellus aureogranulatus]
MSTPPDPGEHAEGSAASHRDDVNVTEEERKEHEKYWIAQYEWLAAAGYRLRSRYSPNWKPSWVGLNVNPLLFEDAQPGRYKHINYAVHLVKNQWVTIKKVDKSTPNEETEVMKLLSNEPLKSNPSNHAVQPIEILQHPTDKDTTFVVLPQLRNYDDPPFETVGEIVGFIRQFLRGMNFLHEHKIIHGDVSINNIMMDASEIYPDGFHPLEPHMSADWRVPVTPQYTRTEKPPKYFIIDFGCSRVLRDDSVTMSLSGTDRSVPEHQAIRAGTPQDAFLIDVYCVGNMLKAEFLDGDPIIPEARPGYKNLEFLRPLVEDMTQAEPDARPTMAEALQRFESIVKKLNSFTLRSRCVKKPGLDADDDLPRVAVIIIALHHWYRAFRYATRRLPAIPEPKTQPQPRVLKKSRKVQVEENAAANDNPTPNEDAGVNDDPIPNENAAVNDDTTPKEDTAVNDDPTPKEGTTVTDDPTPKEGATANDDPTPSQDAAVVNVADAIPDAPPSSPLPDAALMGDAAPVNVAKPE